jgi:hypothetical protein
MDARQLACWQSEYAESRQHKHYWYHWIWDEILAEYGLNTFSEVVDYIRSGRVLTEDAALGAQGRVATLNVACRKMQSLMGFREPEFVVENTDPRDEPIAMIVEGAFRQVLDAGDWSGEVQKCKFDGVLYGSMFAKTGFGSEFVYDTAAWSAPIPSKARELLSEDDRRRPYGPSTEYTNFNIREGFPMMKHVSVRDIYFNKGVRDQSDIRRIYHVVRRPLVDVLHDSRYDDRAKRQVHVVTRRNEEAEYFSLDPYEQDMEYVPCIEAMDLASRQYMVFTEHAQRPLIDWTPYPFPIEKPFRMATPIPMDKSVWGIPYALLLLGQAKCINRQRATVNAAVGRNGKSVTLVKAEKFTLEEQQAIQNARDGEWVNVDGFDPSDPGFMQLAFPPVNADVIRLGDMHWNDQAYVSGLTEQTRNSQAPGDETATSAQLRQEQQNVTVDDFTLCLEKFLTQLGGDVARIMLSRWDPQKLVKVVGNNENIFFWTPLETRRILGSFTLKIIAGSTQKRDRAVQRKQWTEVLPRIQSIYQYIVQEQQAGFQGPVDWHEVLRETLDQYDTTLARRVLRPENTARLLIRLVEQHGIRPAGVSPELQAQVMAIIRQQEAEQQQAGGSMPLSGQEGLTGGAPAQGGAPTPGGSVPFEVSQGIPAPSGVNPQGGQIPGEMAGMAGRV